MTYFSVGVHSGTLNRISWLIGTIIGFLFGGWTPLLEALLVLQGLDIVLGLMTATKKRSISSNIMYLGIKKKTGVWIGLILAHVIDSVLFDNQPLAITGLSFVMVANEGISIAENLGILGVPLPDFIINYLEQIRDQHNTTEIVTSYLEEDID